MAWAFVKGKGGKGRERKGKERKERERKGKEGKGRERTGKEGKGRERKEWLEMGGEKKLLGMTELGCTDGCGRQMGGEEKPLEISELACADGCGRCGCKAMAGNGWGEEAAGDERAWLRGRLRTAWVQGIGWKWLGRRSRWG